MLRYIDKNSDYQECKDPISTGDNVFAGANSTMLYDMNVGKDVIFGAGRLVNKDILNGIVAKDGSCKAIGNFEEYKRKLQILRGETDDMVLRNISAADIPNVLCLYWVHKENKCK